MSWQTHCLHCNTPIEARPREKADGPDVRPATRNPIGTCPACGHQLSAEAVLCIECGYDLRTRQKHKTVEIFGDDETSPGPATRAPKRRKERLPIGFGKVRHGLGFHSVRVALQLLAFFALMVLIGYSLVKKPQAADGVLVLGAGVVIGSAVMAGLVGIVGSILGLWASGASWARLFLLVSLVLDLSALPVVAYLRHAGIPPQLVWIVSFASWVFFMLFLHRLAQFIDEPGAADDVGSLITGGVALFVAVPLLLLLLGLFASLTGTGGLIQTLCLGIIALQSYYLIVWTIKFFEILQTLRAAIAKRLPSTTRESSSLEE
jgi:hypothetical protein